VALCAAWQDLITLLETLPQHARGLETSNIDECPTYGNADNDQ